MINAKILSSTSTFNAVKYNDGKTKSKDNKPETGKLLCMQNFSGMEAKNHWNVSEIKAYFKEYGKVNRRIKNQQLHAVLSVKGKSLNEKQLENAAHMFMDKMGYKDVPYIVYFHNDTANNHVHIVGSRVGKDGKKINADFEKQKSQVVMQDISKRFGFEIPKDFEVAKNLALKFKFSTEAQFNLLMEREGFKVFSKDDFFDYGYNGKKEGSIQREEIKNLLTDPKIKLEDVSSRIKQMKALVYKYAPQYSPEVKILNTKLPGQRDFDPKIKGKFGSDLSDFLKEKFGIDIIYHGNIEKGKPYGYSIIDNTSQTVFKGSEILPLQKLIEAEKVRPFSMEKEITKTSEGGFYKEAGTSLGMVAEPPIKSDSAEFWLSELSSLFDQMQFAEGGDEHLSSSRKRKRKTDIDPGMER